MTKTWEDIKDSLTPEFLATLREAAKVYGHDGDWIAVRAFVRECHYIATGVCPSGDFYEPYD
jgi:hypothetical protein